METVESTALFKCISYSSVERIEVRLNMDNYGRYT